MDIHKSPSGKIIHFPTGYNAFVPAPLPAKIDYDRALVHSLSRADLLLGRLSQESSTLKRNPYAWIRPFIAKEAVLSSRIEGTQASLTEVLAPESKVNPDDLQEVENYIKALDYYGIKRLQDLPLSLRLIRELHAHLMEGARGSHATPGEFRRVQNWIGAAGCTVHSAKFVPPPPDYLDDALNQFETFLHNRNLPALIHIALCHYQFEAIHPFLDGNGRVGRLLITLLLVEHKILDIPLLYLSGFFEANRDEYYRSIYNVTRDGAWNDWLMYFANGVAVQSEDALSRIEQMKTLLDAWKTRLHGSPIALRIIDLLAENPFITINKVVEHLGIAYTSAQRGIQKLESEDIVEITTPKKRNKVYCATELFRIVDG